MRRLVVDLETNGLLRWEPGRDRIVSRVHCAAVYDLDRGETFRYHDQPEVCPRSGPLSDFLDLLPGAHVVGHNAIDYDLPVLRRVYGALFREPAAVTDTLVEARLRLPWIKELDFQDGRVPPKLKGSHSLAAWGHRLGVQKGDFADKADEDPERWERLTPEMMDYCAQDVHVTAALLAHLKAHPWPERSLELEHAFAEEVSAMMGRGVGFDYPAARALESDLRRRLGALSDALTEDLGAHGERVVEYLTPVKQIPRRKVTPFNPNSQVMVVEALTRKYGWRPALFTPSGIAQFDEPVIEALPEDVVPAAVRDLLLEHATVGKVLGMLADGAGAWLNFARRGEDGEYRIHGYVNHNGAHTGRCTHRSPNLAQVPRASSPYGRECRSLFVPSPGMVMVGTDMTGVEARIIGHYLSYFDGGAFARKVADGRDVHSENQAAAGLPTRQDAKNVLYAVCYGALDKKVAAMLKVPLKRGAEVRRAILGGVPGLERLIADVQSKVKDRGYLVGIDGRRLRPRRVFSALNTLVQGAGAVAMKRATNLRTELARAAGMARGVDFAQVLAVHDEYQDEARPSVAGDLARIKVVAIERAGADFNLKCPLTGESKVGASWAETH